MHKIYIYNIYNTCITYISYMYIGGGRDVKKEASGGGVRAAGTGRDGGEQKEDKDKAAHRIRALEMKKKVENMNVLQVKHRVCLVYAALSY